MAIDPVIVKVIKKCQKDPAFFINNFCKVKHPKLGILPFKLFSYQKRCLKEFLNHRYSIFRKCRQCGISTLTGAYALWFAMFKSQKTILIMSKRDDDAKEYLNRNVKFCYNNLPGWMKELWKPKTANEHTLAFSNGSVIRSLTSSPDTLRSNASSLNIIDEAAFIDKMELVWAGGYSTLQHGGEVIVVSCVPKGTYIFDESGLTKIDKFIDDNKNGAYEIPRYNVLGKNNLRSGNLFYNNGCAETKEIITRYNSVEGSLNHKLWSCKNGNYDWHQLKDLNVGDNVAIQYNQNIWGDDDFIDFEQSDSCNKVNVNNEITPELAYFIGLYLAEGSVYLKKNKNGNCIGAIYTISCGDDIGHVFDKLGLHYWLSKDNIHYCISSKNLYLILESLGINHQATAHQKIISSRLLKCSKEIIKFILRGLFDGDGGSRADRGTIKYTTTSKELDLQIRLLLNNMGIIASHYVRIANKANEYIKNNPNKCNAKKINYDSHILELDSYNSNMFYNQIAFDLDHKQNNYALVEHVDVAGDSHDLIPYSLDYAKEMFEAIPFGTWTIKKKYNLFINPIVSKKTRYKTEHLSRKTLLRLFEIAKPYLSQDRVEFFEKIISSDLRWVKILEVKSSHKEVYDFSLPDGDFWAHSVIYNGFLGHQTPKGVGNWYWKTWSDAIDRQNDFNPIIINWWDMDWKLEYTDELSGTKTVIAPTAGIKELNNPHEIDKYGPGPYGKTYWSPWLEGEYRNLATKGDDSRFRQEVLAEFVGTGNTVLSRKALSVVSHTTTEDFMTIDKVDYVNPSTNERMVLDFQDLLWIWKKPYTKKDAEKAIEKAKEEGKDPRGLPLEVSREHHYVLGADPSSGEADDFCAIQVFDITTSEQVAELKIKALPKIFAKMIDYIGRMYNAAHVVCERTGIGQSVTQELDKDVMYPNLYRHSRTTASLKVKYNQIGFPTTGTTKAGLIKQLLDNIGEDGFLIRSTRLYHEFCIFIHLGNNRYGNEPGVGNTDDLVLATCLALEGIQSAIMHGGSVLVPLHNIDAGIDTKSSNSVANINKPRNSNLIAPMGVSSEMYTQKLDKNAELSRFVSQLGGIPLSKDKNKLKGKVDSVTSKKNILKYFK